jgi:hypothetical protein
MTQEQAKRQFEQMSMHDCINMWNNTAADHYSRELAINDMECEQWWNTLSEYLGAWDLIHVVINSGDNFNDSDKYFFFDKESNCMRSFSTKQELIQQIGENFFIDHLMEQKMIVNEHGRTWEVMEGTLLKDTWYIGDFQEVGKMYMNNMEGYIILWEKNGRILKSDI